jgi:2-succinyl-5-enolpyruvyl-6-hydroxy-3-cyclohexene-1-carboxylate synthase
MPTTRAAQDFVAATRSLVVIDRLHPDPDPEHRATVRIEADPTELVLAGAIDPAPGDWLTGWEVADDRAREAIDRSLDAEDEPSELRVARDLAAAIPEGSTLVVGSSMPVRDLDYAMAPRRGIRVLANRGASGIDGHVSTVLGVAAADLGPTFSLCGDLTLLHDAGALLWNARRGLDAVFVVPNNGGGTIFSFLGQRDLPELERLFVTPHGLDLGAIVSAAGADHARVEHARDLVPALRRSAAAPGVGVVEVIVDPERNRRRHAEVQAAVDAAVEGLLET